jgi:hypothetical protein
MESNPPSRVWVLLEVVKGVQSSAYRGCIARDDFNRLLSGTFTGCFVRLDATHWVDTSRGQSRIIVLGRDGEWENVSGSFNLLDSNIVAIGMLKGLPDSRSIGLDSTDIQEPKKKGAGLVEHNRSVAVRHRARFGASPTKGEW